MLDEFVQRFDELINRSRIQELNVLADEEGLPFKKRIKFSSQSTVLKSFKVFDKKGSKRFLGVIEDRCEEYEGVIRFYDYLKTKDLETIHTSIIEIETALIDMPYVRIEPKGALKKLKGFFTSSSLPFSDFGKFHDAYHISDESEDISVLKKSMLDVVSDFVGLTIETNGPLVLIYKIYLIFSALLLSRMEIS